MKATLRPHLQAEEASPYILLVELVSSKRCHAWFDSSSAEGYEYQAQHGQSTATYAVCVNCRAESPALVYLLISRPTENQYMVILNSLLNYLSRRCSLKWDTAVYSEIKNSSSAKTNLIN